jgi:predicted RNase H-like HicB family nuclease
MKYPIALYTCEKGGFVAEVPMLKGCLAQGETLEETLEELATVTKLWLETADRKQQTQQAIDPNKVTQYRQIIQQILLERAASGPNRGSEQQTVLDPERDHYQLVNVGWKPNGDRNYGCILHLDIKDGKIWVQHDGTEDGITDALLALGVPKEDIVLAFHTPSMRKYTGFAVS